MKETSMILMSDFYKQAHAEQYPKGITKLISYATARMTRMPKEMLGDKLTVFGIQAYVKEFLIDRFNETFFNVSLEEAMEQYNEIIGETFQLQYVNTGKFEALHKLGYLPVEVGCLPEGTRVPIRSAFELPEGQCQVPFMYIINTHPDFPWITEFLESVTSSEIWYPMAIANQAYYYRQIVNKWYDVTGCAPETRKSAISEFGFRGGKGSGAAALASAAFLTSFNKTATIPAINYIHNNYGDSYGEIGGGMISTEHSVMCSNFAVDEERYPVINTPYDKYNVGDIVRVRDDNYKNELFEVVKHLTDQEAADLSLEAIDDIIKSSKSWLVDDEGRFNGDVVIEDHTDKLLLRQVDNLEALFLKRLFTEIYPTGALSVVMDSYDYWANIKRCGEGALKQAILDRDGTVFFRGDSGDPADIICGIEKPEYTTAFMKTLKNMMDSDLTPAELKRYWANMVGRNIILSDESNEDIWNLYRIEKDYSFTLIREITHEEQVGTTGLLWEMFGGTENKAGYKVLNKHVKVIYGDSITPTRAENIYRRLAKKGFAACNVALGAGSFSTQCAEMFDENGKQVLIPFTRDTYGIAVKCTYCRSENSEYRVFKNPKTDTGKFKKSQKGLIHVQYDENGEIVAYDGFAEKTLPPQENNLLQPIFRDGKMLKEVTLAEVRQRLHKGDF